MLCLPKSSAFCGWWQSAGQLATAEKQGQNRPRQGSRAGVCEWRAVGLASAVRCPSVAVSRQSAAARANSHTIHSVINKQNSHTEEGRHGKHSNQTARAQKMKELRYLFGLGLSSHTHTRAATTANRITRLAATRKAEKTAGMKLNDFEGQDSTRSTSWG